MKTIQFIILALFFSASVAMAQDNVYVYKAGKVVYHSTVATVDSMTFQLPAGAVTDIDGNVYHSVVIGTQTWMVENLKTTHYRDGSPIATTWGLSIGAWIDNMDASVYGHLYNGYAAVASNLAPLGWHIPTDAEWTTLINYLGANPASQLKEVGTTHFFPDNADATNSTGFTALPGGYATQAGAFGDARNSVIFWSSTVFDSNEGYIWFQRGSGNVYIGAPLDKNFGLSIRCIKD